MEIQVYLLITGLFVCKFSLFARQVCFGWLVGWLVGWCKWLVFGRFDCLSGLFDWFVCFPLQYFVCLPGFFVCQFPGSFVCLFVRLVCLFVCLFVRPVCYCCCCQHCLFVCPIFYSLPVHPTCIKLDAGRCIQIMEIWIFALRVLTLFGAVATLGATCPTVAGTNTTHPECEPCKPGYMRTGNSTNSTVTEKEAGSCITHTKCPPGKYTAVAGTTSRQPTCEACAPGFMKTYTSKSSTVTEKEADSCIAHTKCPPGKQTDVAGTPTSRPTCEACAPGFFSSTSCTGLFGYESGSDEDQGRIRIRVG